MLLSVVTSCMMLALARTVAGRAGMAAAGSRRSRVGCKRTAWPAARSSLANQACCVKRPSHVRQLVCVDTRRG